MTLMQGKMLSCCFSTPQQVHFTVGTPIIQWHFKTTCNNGGCHRYAEDLQGCCCWATHSKLGRQIKEAAAEREASWRHTLRSRVSPGKTKAAKRDTTGPFVHILDWSQRSLSRVSSKFFLESLWTADVPACSQLITCFCPSFASQVRSLLIGFKPHNAPARVSSWNITISIFKTRGPKVPSSVEKNSFWYCIFCFVAHLTQIRDKSLKEIAICKNSHFNIYSFPHLWSGGSGGVPPVKITNLHLGRSSPVSG